MQALSLEEYNRLSEPQRFYLYAYREVIGRLLGGTPEQSWEITDKHGSGYLLKYHQESQAVSWMERSKERDPQEFEEMGYKIVPKSLWPDYLNLHGNSPATSTFFNWAFAHPELLNKLSLQTLHNQAKNGRPLQVVLAEALVPGFKMPIAGEDQQEAHAHALV
ncbi:hypothetical protein ACYPKM_05140 [Pseudomonas aeruginosa]